MSSDEGWEEVYQENVNLEVVKKKKIKNIDTRIRLFHQLTSIFRLLLEKFSVPVVDETIDYNVKNKLFELFSGEENLLVNSINYFKSLYFYKIPSRVYFVLNNTIGAFLEVSINKNINKNKKCYRGSVFYIDNKFTVRDYSFYFSTDLKNFSIFNDVLAIFEKNQDTLKKTFEMNLNYDSFVAKRIRIENGSNITGSKEEIKNEEVSFLELDDKRIKEIPSSYIKFKKHPTYVLESLIKYNQAIHPKRPICGYFRGEPVYLRKNIINLKSEKQFYKIGKIVPEKCFRKYNDLKLYSDFQVKDLVVEDMSTGMYQDYFHENHIPKNCVYIENEYGEEVARILDLQFRKCFTGFRRALPVYKGIFIYKSDLFVFSNFLFEYSIFQRRKELSERGLQVFKNWNYLIKITNKYINIKERIDK